MQTIVKLRDIAMEKMPEPAKAYVYYFLGDRVYSGNVVDAIMGLIVIGVVLMVAATILGALYTPLTANIANDSPFASLATSIPSSLSQAMSIATIIPIVLIASIIIAVVMSLRK